MVAVAALGCYVAVGAAPVKGVVHLEWELSTSSEEVGGAGLFVGDAGKEKLRAVVGILGCEACRGIDVALRQLLQRQPCSPPPLWKQGCWEVMVRAVAVPVE